MLIAVQTERHITQDVGGCLLGRVGLSYMAFVYVSPGGGVAVWRCVWVWGDVT